MFECTQAHPESSRKVSPVRLRFRSSSQYMKQCDGPILLLFSTQSCLKPTRDERITCIPSHEKISCRHRVCLDMQPDWSAEAFAEPNAFAGSP